MYWDLLNNRFCSLIVEGYENPTKFSFNRLDSREGREFSLTWGRYDVILLVRLGKRMKKSHNSIGVPHVPREDHTHRPPTGDRSTVP
jgi:hypothetical protein